MVGPGVLPCMLAALSFVITAVAWPLCTAVFTWQYAWLCAAVVSFLACPCAVLCLLFRTFMQDRRGEATCTAQAHVQQYGRDACRYHPACTTLARWQRLNAAYRHAATAGRQLGDVVFGGRCAKNAKQQQHSSPVTANAVRASYLCHLATAVQRWVISACVSGIVACAKKLLASLTGD